MQHVVAVLERPAKGDRRVKLLQLRLQMLVHQQQRLQRAADVAAATGHDPVNGGFARFGSHRKPSNFPHATKPGARSAFLWIMWIGDSLDVLDTWPNCVEVM